MFKLKFSPKITFSKLATNISKRFSSTSTSIILPYKFEKHDELSLCKISRVATPKNVPINFLKVGNTKIHIINSLSRKTLDLKQNEDVDYNRVEIIADGTVDISGIKLVDATYMPGPHKEQLMGSYDDTLKLLNKYNFNINTSVLNRNSLYETTIWTKKENDTIYYLCENGKSHTSLIGDNARDLLVKNVDGNNDGDIIVITIIGIITVWSIIMIWR